GILYARLAARSFNIPARIAVSVNNLYSEQLAIPPVGTGQYDVFAREGEILHRFSWSGNAPSLQFDFTEGGGNAQSWLDKFALLLPAKLKMKDRKSTRLNSSHVKISYAVVCLKK